MRLSVENLACERGGRCVFQGVSFNLAAGGALTVLGRNGAGKSSLLEILAGRLMPASGKIASSDTRGYHLSESLHYIGHKDALKSALTAGENLAFARDFLGAPALPPSEALAVIGLAHAVDLPVGYLSAGQRRRVALARLLVSTRSLWLLDEPMAALDTSSQQTLGRMIEAHRSGGGIVIATTHAPLDIAESQELTIERPPVSEAVP